MHKDLKRLKDDLNKILEEIDILKQELIKDYYSLTWDWQAMLGSHYDFYLPSYKLNNLYKKADRIAVCIEKQFR